MIRTTITPDIKKQIRIIKRNRKSANIILKSSYSSKRKNLIGRTRIKRSFISKLQNHLMFPKLKKKSCYRKENPIKLKILLSPIRRFQSIHTISKTTLKNSSRTSFIKVVEALLKMKQ